MENEVAFTANIVIRSYNYKVGEKWRDIKTLLENGNFVVEVVQSEHQFDYNPTIIITEFPIDIS